MRLSVLAASIVALAPVAAEAQPTMPPAPAPPVTSSTPTGPTSEAPRADVPTIADGVPTAKPDPTRPGVAAQPKELLVAVAVNSPFSWPDANGLGFSLYLGHGHWAVRLNAARYEPGLIDIGEALYSGATSDLGAGLVYYPNKALRGISLEAGLLARQRDIRVYDENDHPAILETDTQVIAARGLVGYSWVFAGHGFFGVAAGISVGYERGRETQADALGRDMTTLDVSRRRSSAEGYLRLGFVFGN